MDEKYQQESEAIVARYDEAKELENLKAQAERNEKQRLLEDGQSKALVKKVSTKKPKERKKRKKAKESAPLDMKIIHNATERALKGTAVPAPQASPSEGKAAVPPEPMDVDADQDLIRVEEKQKQKQTRLGRKIVPPKRS